MVMSAQKQETPKIPTPLSGTPAHWNATPSSPACSVCPHLVPLALCPRVPLDITRIFALRLLVEFDPRETQLGGRG